MKKFFSILILFIFAVSVFAITDFDKHISNAKVYYDTGEFDKVINELSAALNIVKKNNQKGMVEAYKYLAFSYVAYNKFDKAKQYFIEILKLDPSFDLDRDTISPKIVGVLDKAKLEYKKIQKEEKKKTAEKKAKEASVTTKKNEYYAPSKKVEKLKTEVKADNKNTKVKKEKKVKKKSDDYGYYNPTKKVKKEAKPKIEKKGKIEEVKAKKEKEKKVKNSNAYDFGYYGSSKKAKKTKKEKSNNGKSDLAKNTNPAKNSYIPSKTPVQSSHGRYYKQPTKFNAAWRSFLIPGWGQLYKHQKAKGYIFISTTLLLDLFYVLNTNAVKTAYDDYEQYKIYNADYETEYWNKYEKVYNRYQLFSLIHILFWTYNMTDASFFGWKKINVSMDVNKKGAFMLTLKKEF